MHLSKPYLLVFGSFQTPFPFVFQSFIVVIRFLFRKHLGISIGFPEALVWIALFAFSYVFNASNVTNKIAPIMRWAHASQQAIPSRVREPSKTIAIRFHKRFIVLICFLFRKHLGIFVGFPEALV